MQRPPRRERPNGPTPSEAVKNEDAISAEERAISEEERVNLDARKTSLDGPDSTVR